VNGNTEGSSEQVDYPAPDFPGKLNLRTALMGIDNLGTAIGVLTYDDLWNRVPNDKNELVYETRIQPFVQRRGYRATLTNEMRLAESFQTFG
jgi:hypothetical protein